MKQNLLAPLVEALSRIAQPECEAGRWAGENPPGWDKCLNYDYTESPPTARCDACLAHFALLRFEAAKAFSRGYQKIP